MSEPRKLQLLDKGRLEVTLRRLCFQLIENHGDFSGSVMLSIQPRGIALGRRIHSLLTSIVPKLVLPYGELDVTFFRDDFRRSSNPLKPNSTSVNFLIEGKKVILVDDVLYTGRTIRAAMDAMMAFGRPEKVELLVLVDRRQKRDLPIKPDYTGLQIDSLDSEKVFVRLKETSNEDKIWIESKD